MTEQQFNKIKTALGSLVSELENLNSDEQNAVYDACDSMILVDFGAPMSELIGNYSQAINIVFRKQQKEQEFRCYLARFDGLKKMDAMKKGCKEIGLSLRVANTIYQEVFEN